MWKNEIYGKTIVPEDRRKKKIGFIAQELLQEIPEVVQTHHWKMNEANNQYEHVESELYGVCYSEILPIIIKTTQEQQVKIEKLKSNEKNYIFY